MSQKGTQDEKGGTLFVYCTYLSSNRKVASDCKRLFQILDSHNIEYTKVDLGILPQKREEMVKMSGKTELPQVFVDKDYIGGIDLIEKWNEEDELEQELYLCGYGEEPPKKDKQVSS
jgi:glutaredoxin 3